MKKATVADLRNNFRRLASCIEHGETVQITRRGWPFARLSPESTVSDERNVPKVDFMAQLREIWGERTFSEAEIRAMREI
ncbi:MAG: prevent-host-death protein [Opitutaceae bacterium]|nr:prevent-host-death protein [Opitutaceae bacterium]